MANQQHKKTTNTNHKGRNADPPARYALRHPAEKQSKRRTGQGPTRTTTTRICHGRSGEKPQCRYSQKDAQTNWLLPTQKCETRFLNVVADRQQRKALTLLQSSLSESSHKSLLRCAARDKQYLPCTERWVQEQEKQIVSS